MLKAARRTRAFLFALSRLAKWEFSPIMEAYSKSYGRRIVVRMCGPSTAVWFRRQKCS